MSSTSDPDLEYEDNHPFIVEVRQNRDPHASKDDARGTNIMGVRMLASTFSARRFCATYRLKTTSSFSVPTPYTLENAMILAVEVQYRYQFFYDISGFRASDPARPYIFNMHEIKWCEASAKIMEVYNSSSEDRKLRRRIDRILDIHPINPMFPSDKDKDEEDPEESMRYESGGKPARVQM